MITTAAQTVLRKHGVGRPSDVPEQYWELVEQYRSELVAQATSILGRVEDAEDVVQETFCEAVRNPEKLTQAGSIGAWLRSINRCNALNRVRDNKRDENKHESKRMLAPDRALTTGGFSALELRETISKALETLPPTMKSVIQMRYFEQLSYKEIADKLGMPIGNVGGLLLDASVRLYKQIGLRVKD